MAVGAQARDNATRTVAFIDAAKRAGATTLREIAEAMEARDIKTPSGRMTWHPATVLHIQRMADAAPC